MASISISSWKPRVRARRRAAWRCRACPAARRHFVFTALLSVLSVLGFATGGYSELKIYPSPGNLSSVEHLLQSSRYSVQVDGKSCFVYETDDYWESSRSSRPNSASFVCFSFRNQSVTVKVTCNFTVSSVTIRPKSDKVSFTRSGNTITFTLSEPKPLCVEVNNRERPLFILSDEPDEPDTSAHHYFGPGVHYIGAKYAVAENQRVYIAGGAVVEGTLLLKGHNIKVRGRGILSAGQWAPAQWENDKLFSVISNTGWYNDQEYSGIVMLNSPGWNVNGCGHRRLLKNLKVISWVGCTDGPHTSGNSSRLEDSFLFCNDDVLMASYGTGSRIRNCVVWKGPWGRPIGSLNGGTSDQSDALWEDIDIIGDEGPVQDNSAMLASFRIHGSGERGYKKNFTFRNIRIETPRAAPLIYLNADGFLMEDFTFENITVENHVSYEGILKAGNGGMINGVHFKSITLGGKAVTSLSAAGIQKSGTVQNVTFEGGGPSTPAAPSALTAQVQTADEVRLAWRDNSTDETGFKIDRRQSGTDAWVRIATTTANVTAYTDSGLSAETKFYYMVKAYNAAGNSPYSNVADVTTPPPAPAAPANVTARAAGSTRIELSWTDRSGNETGFKIDRRQSGTTPWVRVASTGANATAWSDAGLPPATRFYYLVKATNAGGDSAYANKADATTLDGIGGESVWRYRKGTAEASNPATAWRGVGFDDSRWAQGAMPIGYSGSAVSFGTELTDMRGNYSCVFLRRSFTVAEPAAVSGLQVRADYDDGFVMWINGTEVARVNVAGDPGSVLPHDATAADNMNGTWSATLTGGALPDLRRGENVIAVQLLNRSLDMSGDCLFDMELCVVGSPLSVAADSDGDSMPDAWEALRLPDASDPAETSESADPDGDGVSNLGEYIAGTDPADPDDTLEAGVKLQDGRIVVSFPTVAAEGTGYAGCTRHYALQHRVPGDDAGWLAVPGYADLVGIGQLVRYAPATDPTPRVYRVQVWLADP
ncbi:MAG: fibronectin type III domain-containing protein [Kiritimatiellae bacterium]|nr:fibronectin type III domain-containing protein [Kiritimatiellia bacterium]